MTTTSSKGSARSSSDRFFTPIRIIAEPPETILYKTNISKILLTRHKHARVEEPSLSDLVNESEKLDFAVTFLTFLLWHLGDEEGENLSFKDSVKSVSREAVDFGSEENKKRVATTAVLTYIVEIVADVPSDSDRLPDVAGPHRDTLVSIREDLGELTEGWKNAEEANDDDKRVTILENMLVAWERVWNTLEEDGALPWLHGLLAKEGYGRVG
ncbi:hypothetical protein DL96DRAFT_1742203 [Flagelloscypha sp. PMI_526]|nr:hypothetical protein DL96DRAFT_1742203 [Flagelloscypha sp. PMI_526]